MTEQKIKKRAPFRSQWKKGNFNDDGRDYPPDEVDSSDYEPLEELVKKFLKGERKPRFSPVYEVDENIDNEAAVASLNPVRSDGFDLADASAAMRRAQEIKEDLKDVAKKKAADIKKSGGSDLKDKPPVAEPQARPAVPGGGPAVPVPPGV